MTVSPRWSRDAMASKPKIPAAVDAGSSRTRAILCLLEDSRVRFLGHGEIESIGWSKGRIADPQALAACIQASIQQAEHEAGVTVEAVVAGLGGASVDGDN